jgi:hypothetical protein
MKFNVAAVVNNKTQCLWNVTPCTLVDRCRHFACGMLVRKFGFLCTVPKYTASRAGIFYSQCNAISLHTLTIQQPRLNLWTATKYHSYVQLFTIIWISIGEEFSMEYLTACCCPFCFISMYLALLFLLNAVTDCPLLFMGLWIASREKEPTIPPEVLQPWGEYECP